VQTRLSLDQLHLDHMTATFPMTPLSPTYWNSTAAVGAEAALEAGRRESVKAGVSAALSKLEADQMQASV